MNKVTIDRELLERIDESAICDGTDATISDDLFTRLVAALAAPRQPEGDGLWVVGLIGEDGLLLDLHGRVVDPEKYRYQSLCLLTDHQRAIAELREECKIHRNSAAGAHNQLRANRLETERLAVDWQAAVAERDTLRQQLAERDATIERLEAGIPRLQEQSFQMRQQRDKLAGLLRDERNWSCVEISCQRGVKDHCLCGTCRILRIDAALAEVK